MSDTPTRTELSALGEFGLIDRLASAVELVNPSSLQGIGDDAAVIDPQGLMQVVTTDMLVEGVHFDLGYVPLKHLGYKAMIVNFSDVYAMNAVPKQVTVAIAISNRFSLEAVDELYAGMLTACQAYGVDLVAATPPLPPADWCYPSRPSVRRKRRTSSTAMAPRSTTFW